MIYQTLFSAKKQKKKKKTGRKKENYKTIIKMLPADFAHSYKGCCLPQSEI